LIDESLNVDLNLAMSYCKFLSGVYLETESTAGIQDELQGLQENEKFWQLLGYFEKRIGSIAKKLEAKESIGSDDEEHLLQVICPLLVYYFLRVRIYFADGMNE